MPAGSWTIIMSQQRGVKSMWLRHLPGEPRTVSAAGVTRTTTRLQTLENPAPFAASKQSRLVIVADDERAARAALEAIRWFKTRASQGLRDRWSVSALLLGYANDAAPAPRLEFPPVKGFFDHPEQPESRYAWRWVTYQAPDVLSANQRRRRAVTRHTAQRLAGRRNGRRDRNRNRPRRLWHGS